MPSSLIYTLYRKANKVLFFKCNQVGNQCCIATWYFVALLTWLQSTGSLFLKHVTACLC